MLPTNSIRHAFNRAQSSYNEHCRPQLHTGNYLLTLAKQLAPSAKRIIDLGCGTGLITKSLAQHFPQQEIIALDIAEKLLLTAKEQLCDTQVKILECSFDELPKSINHIDLIFSNLALHWSNQLSETLTRLHSVLNQYAHIIFSIPIQGTMHELEGFFSIRQFHEAGHILNLLSTAGFTHINYQHEKMTYHFDSTLEALRSIKFVGATHTNTRRGAALNGKSWLNRATINAITYHIGYFFAQRSTP